MSAQRPLQWLESAAPAEIAEALLSVDPGKAAAIALYITERMGAEIGEIASQFEQRMADNPMGTLGSMLAGAAKGFMNSR